MSFTQAMQAGQPGEQPGQGGAPLVAEMQQTVAAVQSLLQKLRRVPGINQGMFEQGVQQMSQGIQMIAQAMPKRQAPPAG
jgi:hypothetical protein